MGEHVLENLPQTYALIIGTIAAISMVILALEKAEKSKRRKSKRKRRGIRR